MTARCGERISEDAAGEVHQHPVHRYLGLTLGGAKSDRTSLAVIDYYRKQEKAFVVDVFESIGAQGHGPEELTSDQVLLDLIGEVSKESTVPVMGVDAPLSLPPCITGCDVDCHGYEKCKRPEVKWMRNQYQKARSSKSKLKHFTPYTQRPVDLYFRYKHPDENLFQDETMGANMAPQAARMQYLKTRVGEIKLVEVWPKLALFHAQKTLKLTRREALGYRHIEHGAHLRARILERLLERRGIFVYERDMKKLVASVSGFDALICAWMAMQYDLGQVAKPRLSEFPFESGWVEVPEL